MTAAKKYKSPLFPEGHEEKPGKSAKEEKKESGPRLRLIGNETDKLREKLQQRILENPKIAQKAALIISLWVNGKDSPSRKKSAPDKK